MKKCYLCDKHLVSKEEFNNENSNPELHTITHEEHIIQNALGGFLKSRDILCEKCGNDLNTLIDVSFINIFKLFTYGLDVKIDRKTKRPSFKHASFTLFSHKKNKVDIKIYKDCWQPFKNDFFVLEDKNLVLFLLNNNNEKNYNHLFSLWANSPLYNPDYTIKKITNLRELEGFTQSKFEITNEAFKKGFAKIAVEYAILHNIAKENLNLALLKNNFLDQIIFLPYYIASETTEKFENLNELSFEPFHSLYLFNHYSRNLVCYIDLFNTFKGFIILNKNYYEKNISKLYIQKTRESESLKNDFHVHYLSTKLQYHYKSTIENSFESILSDTQNHEQQENYLLSVTKTNHYYFNRLLNYISKLNLDRDYIKY